MAVSGPKRRDILIDGDQVDVFALQAQRNLPRKIAQNLRLPKTSKCLRSLSLDPLQWDELRWGSRSDFGQLLWHAATGTHPTCPPIS